MSVKAAADELCLTPSALSHQIRALEGFLDTQLFERSGNRLTLTLTGQGYAGKLSHLLDSLLDETETVRAGPRILRVLSTPGFAARWLVPRLPRLDFAQDIRLRVSNGAPSLDFATNEADVVIQWADRPTPGLSVQPLMASVRYPVISPALKAREGVSRPEDLLRLSLFYDETDDAWPEWFSSKSNTENQTYKGPSVRIAFTIDDLPLWPQSYPPVGYTAEGIVDAIRSALQEHGIHGVYAFSNSWPLEENPEYAKIFDDWVADGHHVANHTHSHVQLPDVTADAFIADIDAAEHHLRPWLSKAPLKLFRHPLCHWGDTARKLEDVNAHLRTLGLMPVDVTSWAYEWTWNRAYRNALDLNDADAVKFVKSSFLDFSAAQLRHDMAAAEAWFGGEIVGITLGHNVPFFADIAMDYFSRLKQEGAVFVPLEQALTGPVQDAVGSVVSGEFLVLQQKLAAQAGRQIAKLPQSQIEVHARIVEMAKGQNG